MTVLRMRRVQGRWPVRRRYAVELLDDSGKAVNSTTTAAPTAFLVKKAGVHSTDSWEWVHAADEAFDRGSSDWVTDPLASG